MLELETKMVTLELEWREVDDLVRAARTELAANEGNAVAVVDAIRHRIARGENMKLTIMQQIVALEEEMD